MRQTIVIFAFLAVSCTQNSVGVSTLDSSGYDTAAEFLSCLEGRAALVSAHRGGPAPGFPENAIETFENTLSQVPALIETDVRETRDGTFILIHDDTVDRTTNGTGTVASMTLEKIKQLRLVDDDGNLTDFEVPTLGEALRALKGRTILQLDVKRGVNLSRLARVLERSGAEGYAAVITYTDNGAIITAQAAPDVSVIAGIDSMADVDALASRGLEPSRLIAWTGIVDEPEGRLYGALGADDISTSGGALGRLDRRAARGQDGVYQDLEAAGLDIIATDRPVAAARALGLERLGTALKSCTVSQKDT